MAFGITETGYVRPTFDDLQTQAETELKSQDRFGENLDFDTNSIFYQLFASFNRVLANTEQRIEDVYNSNSVDDAEGVPLDHNVRLIGISREQGVKSTGQVTFTGVFGTVIPSNFQVSTQDNIVFSTTAQVIIQAGGNVDANIQASEVGESSNVAADTITTIVNPLANVTSVTNANPTTIGQNQETDPELKVRHAQSTSKGSGNTVDSIFAEIVDVSGVVDALVTDDKVTHDVTAIVQGGTDQDVGEAMFRTVPGGIESLGSITVNVEDSQGIPQTFKFSRPTTQDVYYRLTLTTTAEFPVDGETQIENAVVVFGTSLGIGEDVYTFQVLSAIAALNLIGLSNVIVELSEDDITYGLDPVIISSTEIATTDAGKVAFV